MKEKTPTNGSRTPTNDPNLPQSRKRLTNREIALVFAWVRLSAEGRENKAEAARRAGYTGRLDTLSKQAARVLAKPQAQAMIDELMREALTVPNPRTLTPAYRFRHIMGVNEILANTTFLARATLDDVLDENGKFDIVKARETLGIHALKTIQYYRTGEVKSVTLRDRNGSLELMGRHFQLWNDGEDPETEMRRLLEEEAAERKRLKS